MNNIEKTIASDLLDNLVDRTGEKWEPITPDRILIFPIKVIPGITRSADNPSFATDADGTEWICGFFDGEVCRVAVSKP